MYNLGVSIEEIATYLRTNKGRVDILLSAYKLMQDFIKIPGNEDKGERKFSYFITAYSIKQIRERLKQASGFKRDFCKWIGEGKIPEVNDLKRLVHILEKPSAREQFEKSLLKDGETPKEWFNMIYHLIELDDPTKASGVKGKVLNQASKMIEATGEVRFHFQALQELADEASIGWITQARDSLDDLMAQINKIAKKKVA
jgi:hypothetical protein